MTCWVLDDGPFGRIAQHHLPTWNWRAGCFGIVEEVASGAAQDRSGRRANLLKLRVDGQPVVTVHSIMAGTPAAHYLFDYLRPRATSATKDLGEDASIAFCAHEREDAIFVTMDKGAAFTALAELGPGRVATPFDFWADLVRQGVIDIATGNSLFDQSVKALSLPGVPSRFRH